MRFEIDNETYKDLEIFTERSGARSIFSLFNRTRTEGGKRMLTKLMLEPTANRLELTERTDTIRFFYEHSIELNITHHQLDMIDHYLAFNKRCLGNNAIDAVYDHYSDKINSTNDYYVIVSGIKELIKLFRFLSPYVTSMQALEPPQYLAQKLSAVQTFLNTGTVKKIVSSGKKLNCFQVNSLDNFFRKVDLQALKELIAFVYEADVFESVAEIAKKPGWCLPEYRTDKLNELEITGLVHPALENPVDNDLVMDAKTTLIFLTGPNMAGKSSFLKAVGIAIYLAHIGFPVPAKRMYTPVYCGLITTINLPDNISEGLSHYYNEVKRVKKTASKLLENEPVFVIFDELFRGTNLKDAFEATLLVTSLLAGINFSKFLVSSHFTELTPDLRKLQGIDFKYFGCMVNQQKVQFSYKLKSGVSHDRLGMHILNGEGILSMLNEVVEKNRKN